MNCACYKDLQHQGIDLRYDAGQEKLVVPD